MHDRIRSGWLAGDNSETGQRFVIEHRSTNCVRRKRRCEVEFVLVFAANAGPAGQQHELVVVRARKDPKGTIDRQQGSSTPDLGPLSGELWIAEQSFHELILHWFGK